MRIVGVDPGYKGCLCFNIDGKKYLYDMPVKKLNKTKKYDIKAIDSYFKKHKPTMAVIEQINPSYGGKNQKNSAVSDAKLYGCFMMLMGVAIANNCVAVPISPQKWKSAFNLIGAGKKASMDLVKDVKIKRDDEADAYLMMKYCEKLYGSMKNV